MSLAIIETPSKIVQQDIPENSKWSAVWHPIIWKFQRRDFVITSIADGGSPTSVSITGAGDFTSELEAGQTIYVISDNGNQEGMFEILDVSFSGGSTTITYDGTPGTGMVATGYANFITARSFYMMEVKVVDYATGVAVPFTDYCQARPDTAGNIKVDLQEWLQSTVSIRSQWDYLARSEGAKYLGHRYDIEIREYWKEAGYGDWVTFTTLGDLAAHYITNSAKQIGDLYGQNMAEFVMWPTDATYEHNKGKFTTMFKRPVYFSGYPFCLGFCYSNDIENANQRISACEDQRDINGTIIAQTDDVIDRLPELFNRVTLKSVFDEAAYPSNVKTVDFYLKAKQTGSPVDPDPINLQIAFTFGAPPNVQVVNTSTGKTIGYTHWDTDYATTMGLLVTSINTNTANGTPFNLTYPFDNSDGFTASFDGLNTVSVSAPAGSGSSYNGQTITVLFNNAHATLTVTDSPFAGGSAGFIDAPGPSTAVISEVKTIDINNDCNDNDVCLRWATPRGGYDYWVFKRSQQIKDTTSNEMSFEKYIENLEDDSRRKQVYNKDVQEEIDLGSEMLTTDQVKGLRYLLSSIEVEMYVPNDISDTAVNFKWLGVSVKSGTFAIFDTFDNKHDIKLTLMPPQRYNQRQ